MPGGTGAEAGEAAAGGRRRCSPDCSQEGIAWRMFLTRYPPRVSPVLLGCTGFHLTGPHRMIHSHLLSDGTSCVSCIHWALLEAAKAGQLGEGGDRDRAPQAEGPHAAHAGHGKGGIENKRYDPDQCIIFLQSDCSYDLLDSVVHPQSVVHSSGGRWGQNRI